MIEFIIPLNLPLRAVKATEAFASPPESLQAEIDRFKHRRSHESFGTEGATSDFTQESGTRLTDTERERELDQLRHQQDLFRNAVSELKIATNAIKKSVDGMVQEFRVAAIEIAEAISAKLVLEEVNSNRFPIANLVHEVIGRLDTTAAAVVRLHPDDLLQLQNLHAIDPSANEQSIQFIADPTLSRGDCKAKAGEITVTYGLRRQIDEIRRQLLSTVDGHAEP